MLSTFLLTTLMAPVANIVDLGATPNDATDDTAAIQAAFDKIRPTGGTVVVPKGRFLLRSARMYGNTVLQGEGPESVLQHVKEERGRLIFINPASGAGAEDLPIQTNIRVQNLTFRGNADTEPLSQQVALLTMNGVEDVIVENCQFIAFRGDGIYIGSGNASTFYRKNTNILIRNNRFDGVTRQNRNGISVIGGTKITIEGNYFTRTSSSGSPGPIDFEPNKIPGNTVADVIVRNNTFEDNGGSAIIFDVPMGQGALKTRFRNILIEGNVIRRQQRRGILINQWTTMTGTETPVDAIVRNNTIDGADIAMQIEGVRGVTVTKNTIRNIQQGVMVGPGPKGHGVFDVRLEDNTLENIGLGDTNNGGAAFVLFNARRVQILNNQIRGVPSIQRREPVVVLFRAARGGGEARDIQIEGNTGGFKPYRVWGSFPLDPATVRTGTQ